MLAYYDGLRGLYKCKALKMVNENIVHIKFTCDRGPYKRGETLNAVTWRTFPRQHFHFVRGSFGTKFYTTPYNWEELLNGN
jgi:hypothetical protein